MAGRFRHTAFILFLKVQKYFIENSVKITYVCDLDYSLLQTFYSDENAQCLDKIDVVVDIYKLISNLKYFKQVESLWSRE